MRPPVDTGRMRHVAGVMRADDALERLSFVHLYTVSPDRMRQNESVGLNSFRIEIGPVHITEFLPSCAAWEPAGLLASARAPARSEHPAAGACGQEPTTGNRCRKWCPAGIG